MPDRDPLVTADPHRPTWLGRSLCGLLALLVVLQALLVPAQRTAERAHFHVVHASGPLGVGTHGAAPVPSPAHAFEDAHEPGPLALMQHPPDSHAHARRGRDLQRGAEAQALFRHKRDVSEHEAAHQQAQHAVAAVHEHAPDRADVVYVDAHASEPAAGGPQTGKRVGFDVDAVLQGLPLRAVTRRHPAPAAALAANFRSRSELPLERPPRVGA